MKKLVLMILAVMFVFGLSSCKPVVDTTAPVITQVSEKQVTFTEGDAEPNWGTYFTIEDETDGTIQLTNSMIEEDVDMLTPGTYTVTLTVTDAAGNESTSSITITVEEEVFVPVGDIIATYEGVAPVGMTDAGTLVVINFYDDGTFDLSTSKKRGEGPYVIESGTITLTYEQEHPDGGDWVLTGTINTDDITDPSTVFTIDPVEYAIDMGAGPVVMDVGTTTFNIVIGSKAEITKVEEAQIAFWTGDEAPDWTTYFTVEDEIDGTIEVTAEMIDANVDFSVDGYGTVTITVENSSGNVTTLTIMIFVNEPELLNSYNSISVSDNAMMGGTIVTLEIYQNNKFKIYTGETLRGSGAYELVDQALTLTYEDPMYEADGVTLLPTIEATIDTETLEANTVIMTDVTSIYVGMGPGFGMVLDYGPLYLEREAQFTYHDVSVAEDAMMNGTLVSLKIFDDNTFSIYTNHKLRGKGTFEIVDQAITFTYVDPMYEADGVTLLPTIEGTIDTETLEAGTVITTAVTSVYVGMGPGFGMVLDYGELYLEREAQFSYQAVSAATDPMMNGTEVELKIFEDNTFSIYTNDTLRGKGTYEIVDQAITFTYVDPMYEADGVTLLPTIEATFDTETLTVETVITAEVTSIYVGMGPGFGMVLDYGKLNFEREAEFIFEGLTPSTDPMMVDTMIYIKLFDDNTFSIYTNDKLRGKGTFEIVDQAITFTYVDPMYEADGVTLLPTIEATIDTTELDATSVLSTTATNIYVGMGPGFGMVLDYGAIDFTVPAA